MYVGLIVRSTQGDISVLQLLSCLFFSMFDEQVLLQGLYVRKVWRGWCVLSFLWRFASMFRIFSSCLASLFIELFYAVLSSAQVIAAMQHFFCLLLHASVNLNFGCSLFLPPKAM